MITEQLSYTYLTNFINVKNFQVFKECYEKLLDENLIESHKTILDKEIAAKLFESIIDSDFFFKKSNLVGFVNALPEQTQKEIIKNGDAESINDLKWNNQLSNFLIEEYDLSERFKYESKENETNLIDFFTIHNAPEKNFKKLKEYQSEVYYRCYNYLKETPFSRCILQMPTGSGKTRTAMELVCDFMNENDKDVIWLANTEELCNQAYDSFNEIWAFLGQKDIESINHLAQQNKPYKKNFNQIFHVCTIQSLKNIDEKTLNKYQFSLENISLVIVDEAHISVAETYKASIEILIGNGAKLLGLTATPGRELKKGSDLDGNKELAEFYFNKIFQLNFGDESPIEYLRKKGILSNAYFHSIEIETLAEKISKRDLENFTLNKEIPKSIEDILTNDITRNIIIISNLHKLCKEGKKIIFFGTSVAHSVIITILLKSIGVVAEHIDGNTGKSRGKIIESFKKGEIQVLCNYGVLSTGFDDPKIDVVFMARPTSSIILYSQIIGRGLRGPVIGGTNRCDIYTVFDNIAGLPSNEHISEYFDDYFINK
jgi:superfamily II DNA or RNA helicase